MNGKPARWRRSREGMNRDAADGSMRDEPVSDEDMQTSEATRFGERRRYPRIRRAMNLSVAGHDRRGIFFLDPVRSIDISRGGVVFPLVRPVAPGTEVWVQLSDGALSGPPIERKAQVRRVEDPKSGVGRRVAVEFGEPLPAVLPGPPEERRPENRDER